MFIEQIIKFELRGPGPPDRTYNAKLVIFRQNKVLQKNKSSSELLLTAKYIAEGNASCFPSPGPSHLQNLSKKFYVFKA